MKKNIGGTKLHKNNKNIENFHYNKAEKVDIESRVKKMS